MDTANNQTQNLNYNPHNPNLTNPSSKKFARDYDKEPLVIKSYERLFIVTLPVSSLFFAGVLACFVRDFIDGYTSDYKDLYIVPVMFLYTLAWYLFLMIFNKHEIKFTNKYIDFIVNGKVKRWCLVKSEDMSRPFFLHDNFSKDKKIGNEIFLYIIFIGSVIFSDGLAITLFFFMYVSNVFIKICFYAVINCSLKGFKIFPFLKVAEPSYPYYVHRVNFFFSRYYLVYLYKEKIYMEIKEYFLQKDIDIDNVRKSYYFM